MSLGGRLAALLALVAAGCEFSWTIGAVEGSDGGRVLGEVPVRLARQDRVDVLLVVDDSPSMARKQATLGDELRAFADRVATSTTPADWRIGVVTTNMGAGAVDLARCPSGGLRGRLQARGAGARETCLTPTDRPFVRFNAAGRTGNLPSSQTLADTLACMAAVGSQGCSFEQPLEAAHRALVSPPPENLEFVRPDAALIVVFITDEDDCSVTPTSDLFSPGKVDAYGPLASFRCSRFGLVHGDPPQLLDDGASGGPLASVAPAPNLDGAGPGRLVDVRSYLAAWLRPGVVKADPNEIGLVAVAGAPSPVETVLVPRTASEPLEEPIDPYPTCQESCGAALQHTCGATGPTGSTFVADPAVRLAAVASPASLPRSRFVDLCAALGGGPGGGLAATLEAQIDAWRAPEGCLPLPLADRDHPQCVVEDAPSSSAPAAARLPSCDAAAPPCWRIEADPRCLPVRDRRTHALERLHLVVDRGGAAPPPGTVPRARCLTTVAGAGD